MKKIIGLFAAVAILAAMALPAAAASPDAGVFRGNATVAENAACGSSGTGLGFLSQDTAGSWVIDTPSQTVTSAVNGAGVLYLCGDLAPTTSEVGGCASTGGSNGEGSANFINSATTDLEDVKWAASAGGSFVVTGDADSGDENLVALVQALDDQIVLSCLDDAATTFQVTAVYAIAP